LSGLRPQLDRIAAINDRTSLARYLGSTLRADVDALKRHPTSRRRICLGLWVAQDLGDPSRYLPFIFQGGLDMPDRDY